MSANVGNARIAYQKTKVFDTPGAHTFIHPLPGKNLEVFVELFGGGGGAQYTTGAATDGGDTIWDTAGSATTAVGGSGPDLGDDANTGFNGPGLFHIDTAQSGGANGPGLFTNGTNHYGASVCSDGYAGNVGDVKRFNATINGNINITVGAGGTGNGGDGKAGACVVHYNVIESEQPVTVLPTPEVDEYLEFSWRTAANAASQTSPSANTVTTLTLDTEVLDTGNYGSISGNEITLAAGTYTYSASVPIGYTVQSGDIYIRLYNVTDGVLIKSIQYPVFSSNRASLRPLTGAFKISSPKNIRLEIVSSIGDLNIGKDESAPITSTELEDRTQISLVRKAYS